MNRLAISMPAPLCSSGVVVAEGSGLLYTFDIKVGKSVHKVNVDAKTGAIVEDTIDSGNG